MKKILVLAALLLVAPGLAMAADDVSATAHNLATAGGAGDNTYDSTSTSEVCVFCHTPHQAPVAVPLWNHDMSAAAYTPYTSSTIEMQGSVATEGIAISNLCLSCHDGTIAVGAVGNFGYNKTDPAAGGAASVIANTEAFYVGTDMSDDHPVGMTYDITAATGDDAFHTVGDATTSGARFYGTAGSETVECGSCHNPHEATLSYFLRVDNSDSSLCVACHIK